MLSHNQNLMKEQMHNVKLIRTLISYVVFLFPSFKRNQGFTSPIFAFCEQR